MADTTKHALLPPRPISTARDSPSLTSRPPSAANLRDSSSVISRPPSTANLRDSSSLAITTTRPSPSVRPILSIPDINGLKKRGQGLKSWICVDSNGTSQIMEVDKFTMMRRCDLPARDLRLLDPLFVYPSTILGREKAIVVNLEQIRCIITSDEVFLLNSLDRGVLQYVIELQRRLNGGGGEGSRTCGDSGGGIWNGGSGNGGRSGGWNIGDGGNVGGDGGVFMGMRRRGSRGGLSDDGFGGGSPPPDYLPFEFRALEVALEAACTYLDGQAAELEIEAYPLLDELTSKISTLTLERVRRLKSRLVALTRRVQKVRDEIEQLMDDDGDMAEMYLTEKKRRLEISMFGDQSLSGMCSAGGGVSVSAPVSPVSSPPLSARKLEKSFSFAKSRHESTRSSEANDENIDELEMLLEAYFVVIDNTLNKLTSLKEYIDDTEDFINIQLDNVRNQLIQFELILTTATFVVAIFGVVAGVFGMNFNVPLFDVSGAFNWVLVITGVTGLIVFCAFLMYFKYRRLMPL